MCRSERRVVRGYEGQASGDMRERVWKEGRRRRVVYMESVELTGSRSRRWSATGADKALSSRATEVHGVYDASGDQGMRDPFP